MNIRDINQQIEEGSSLKMLAQAYSELASVKLKRIRNEVERNRYFYNDLSRVYALIQYLAGQRNIQLQQKKKKSISIVLTSNFRFYGNINTQTIKYFILNTSKFSTDRIVVGKTGSQYLKAIRYFHPFKSVVFKNDLPTFGELGQLLDQIKDYEETTVFFSEFKSVLIQTPLMRKLTQSSDSLVKNNQSNENLYKDLNQNSFIFEPDILKMLQFFDSQIKELLLEETFLEAELARTASRLISMDQAQSKANEYIKKQKGELAHIRSAVTNTNLLETLASLSLWKGKSQYGK